ncbi:hypothetical protein C8F01DRAFT_986408, partial [Mycena amicta]
MSSDTADAWRFPRLVHVPSRARGRKPVSIPDITQFALVTRSLFGVGCRTPTEVYASGTYNEVSRCCPCPCPLFESASSQHAHLLKLPSILPAVGFFYSFICVQLFRLELDLPKDLHPHAATTFPRTVLARVARDAKTRSDNSLESEVATMVFVRQNFPEVPVPRVYGYCPMRDNAIGLPFSIVSFTDGVDMHGVPWEDLPLELKLIGVRDFAKIVAQLTQLTFKSIGSIYFK